MNEFDKFATDYNKDLDSILTSSIGASSNYFAEYKIKEVYNIVKNRINPIKILDFGCGIGKNSLILEKYFPESEIYGIDVSAESIQVAKKQKTTNCIFSVYNGLNINIENDSVDIIFISNVFHHIPHEEHSKILSILQSKLSNNGYLFLFEHNTLNPLTLKIVNECEFDNDAKLLNFWYAKKLLKEAYFSNIGINFILFIPPFLKKLLFLEKYLKWLPMGGQYYIVGQK